MRKSRTETAETRERIVEVAARRFRVNGIHATGLSDIMSEAGLTHGGFYRHFQSKEQLVAEACTAAMTNIVATLEGVAEGLEGKKAYRAVVDHYLSTTHRDDDIDGCPLAGMGSELARGNDDTRVAASQAFDTLVEMLTSRISGKKPEETHADAVFAVAAMMGAVTLSRILPDGDASAAVLSRVKERLALV